MTELQPGERDLRREKLMAKLGEHFPSGATVDRYRLYIANLKKHDLHFDDVAEAVERIIVTREQRTFPPLALIYRVTKEVRAGRLKAARQNELLNRDRTGDIR